MLYKFICPKCNKEKTIAMSIAEYTDKGHKCECGENLKRNPQDFCKNYKANCDGFCGKCHSL